MHSRSGFVTAGPESLAREVLLAHDSARQLQPLSSHVPEFDIAQGYEVAEQVHRARVQDGARPVGRKIGFSNANLWPEYGVHEPIWGYLYDTTVVDLESTAATCSLDGLAEPKIEPEIVFCLRTAPAAGAGLADLVDAIEWVAHGYEIVQSHFPGWQFTAADAIADSALHGKLLIGPRKQLDALGDDAAALLEAFSLSLFCNGRLVETGRGANVLGNPLSAIAHLASVLEKQINAPALEAGEIVTTGTITAAYSAVAGETWRSNLAGIELAGLTVEFT